MKIPLKVFCVKADSIKPENFTDPVILDLIEKITTTADPSLHNYQGASEIITKDGRCFQKSAMAVHGRDNDPLSDEELEVKFSGMASRYMDKGQIKKVFDTCWNVERLDDLGILTKLMVFPAAKS